MLAKFRENGAHLDPRFALLLELEGRRKRQPVCAWNRLVRVLFKRWLWVPRIHVRRSTRRKNMDHPLRLDWEMRLFRRERAACLPCGAHRGLRLVSGQRSRTENG